MSVPLDLGLTHQFVALMVLAFAVAHWRATKGAYEG
jgi:cytochrome c oxidase assembly protein subunit 15